MSEAVLREEMFLGWGVCICLMGGWLKGLCS